MLWVVALGIGLVWYLSVPPSNRYDLLKGQCREKSRRTDLGKKQTFSDFRKIIHRWIAFHGVQICWNFFNVLFSFKVRRKKMVSKLFLTVRTLFWTFFSKNFTLFLNRCKTCYIQYTKDKLFMFFPPERWVHGHWTNPSENLIAIRWLLTVWHVCEKNRK